MAGSSNVNAGGGNYASTQYDTGTAVSGGDSGGYDYGNGGLGGLQGMSRDFDNLLPSTAPGPFGRNWYCSSLPTFARRSSDGLLVYTGLPRRQLYFETVGSGVHPALFFSKAQLVREDDSYVITMAGGTRVVFEGAEEEPGDIQGFILPDGARVDYSYDDEGRPISMTRVVDEINGTTNGYYYEYASPGSPLITKVTLKIGGANVNRIRYEYVEADDANGLVGDLRLVIKEVYISNSGLWEETDRTYYRYYITDSLIGYAHGLKFVVNGEGWRRMFAAGLNPLSASEDQVAPYAASYLQYEPVSQRVSLERCNGTEVHSFAYVSRTPTWGNFTDSDFNRWTLKTTYTRPDGNVEIFYANEYQEVILKVVQETGSSPVRRWCNFVSYDSLGRIAMWAEPSAVESYSETSVPMATLRGAAGLIYSYRYNSRSDLIGQYVQQGSGGTPVTLQKATYISHEVGDTVVDFPATITIQQTTVEGEAPATTSHAYTFYTGTFQISKRVTTFPIIPASQNGTGVAATRVEVFDLNGKLIWSRNERHFLTASFYDPVTFSMVRRVEDVDTKIYPAPNGWTTPTGGGLNLTSDFESDLQGRLTQTLGPWHQVDLNGSATMIRRGAWTVLLDSAHEVRRCQGYVHGQEPTLSVCVINPVYIERMDAAGRTTDQIQAVRTDCGCGAIQTCCSCDSAPLSTGGRVTIEERFPQASWCRWQSMQYDDGGRRISSRLYFAIPEFGIGRPIFNFGQTEFRYDAMGRQDSTRTPGGTFWRTTFTAMGWLSETFVGTVDAGEGSNMRIVTRREYDDGHAGGDGNLTTLTQFSGPGVDEARITRYTYDWRDRVLETITTENFREVSSYDNVDRVIASERRTNGSPPLLLTRSTTDYDNQGRVFQQKVYAVDTDGHAGNFVSGLFWYDAAGNQIKARPMGGKAYRRGVYDGVNRQVATYLSVDGSSSSSSSGSNGLGSLGTDLVVEQTERVFNDGGNAIFESVRQRFHDDETSGAGSLGPLKTPSLQPKARDYYVASYPDPLGRLIATANYGTNGGVTIVRPETIPNSTEVCLVSLKRYSSSGTLEETQDPNGVITRQEYDDAGRLIKMVENYQPSC